MSHIKDPNVELQQLEARYLERANRVRTFRNLLAENPNSVPELQAILNEADEPSPATARAPSRRPSRTTRQHPCLEPVLAFLRENNNGVFTARDLAEGAGLRLTAVNSLLYASKDRHRFYWIRVRSKNGGTKMVYWREKENEQEVGYEMSEMEWRSCVSG